MFCMFCGQELPNIAKFCFSCGKPVEIPGDIAEDKPEEVAVESVPQEEKEVFCDPIESIDLGTDYLSVFEFNYRDKFRVVSKDILENFRSFNVTIEGKEYRGEIKEYSFTDYSLSPTQVRFNLVKTQNANDEGFSKKFDFEYDEHELVGFLRMKKLFEVAQNRVEKDDSEKTVTTPSDWVKHGTNVIWLDAKKDLYMVKSPMAVYEGANRRHTFKQSECSIIRYDDIAYYEKTGDIQYTSKVSGGGGGGSSIKGAIVGGIIAGEAGAIIGSRNKINEVNTVVETHDTRQTVLYYKKDGGVHTLSVKGYAFYEYLLKHIPEKDLIYKSLMNN